MSSQSIHVALLDCDKPVPLVYAVRGMYSDIFRNLILDTGKRAYGSVVRWEFKAYYCVERELPSEEDMKRIDAIVITGSSSSAYDDEPWIIDLIEFIRRTYIKYPDILLFGSCFGHQLIAQSLFALNSPHTSIVTRSPNGWELGIASVTLSDQFLTHFGLVGSNSSQPSTLRMQFVHADHVSELSNPILPSGFVNIGSTKLCAIQGLWEKNRVLTYQGHIEFDEFVNRETIRAFGTICGWDDERMQTSLASTEGVDDSAWASSVLVRFFMEGLMSSQRDLKYGSKAKHKEP